MAGDNITWGTSMGDNIVWGTSADADVTWGSSAEEVIVYDDTTEPRPSLDLEFGDTVPVIPDDLSTLPTVIVPVMPVSLGGL
jgi:hypothetical protein